MPASANIAQHLPLMAAQQPQRAALKIPRGRNASGQIDYLTLSFAELEQEVNAWAIHLQEKGVKTGDRTLVMVRQGLPLIAAAFALFKIGAVPIVIDPGMGLKSFLSCVARSRPGVLLGIPFAQLVSRVARKSFHTVEIRVTASGNPLSRRAKPGNFGNAILVHRDSADLAAIFFTSGSTGAPKGVCYEHGMFAAQVRLIRETYAIEPGEIDLPMLPIFALFNPALGMTTVVPELDPSKPATMDPAKIVQAIQQEHVTNSFGSPTLWGKIADYCAANKIVLSGMKRVLCAGAPVPARLWAQSRELLPNGKLHSPYGATESLPISSVSSDEVLPILARQSESIADASGGKGSAAPVKWGACVGRVVMEIDVKVVAIYEGPMRTLAEVTELAAGEIGEIIVRGPVVTKSYDALPDATALAKVADNGAVWHRMGDCGYRDEEGRLWFCGRKAERVITPNETLFTEPCEQVFRTLDNVARCALVGLGEKGAQVPAVVFQTARKFSSAEQQHFAETARARAKEHAHTAQITRFYFHPAFPVDVRHNAKIHRLTLAKWAATTQGYPLP
ncbi:MAG: fatty acid CoA ligase family protein [Nibricoccus sp.]